MARRSRTTPAAAPTTPAPYAAAGERWAAVLARDVAADQAFVYAVRTTGIYCRASCASRRPRRENVEYFPRPEAAEAAGYRACRRCRPRDTPAAEQRGALFTRLCRLIESAEQMPTLAELARLAGLSRFHLQREFRGAVGLTPREYRARRRREQVARTLTAAGSVTEAIHAAGYGCSGQFYGEADTVIGMPARTFRAGAAGECVDFAIADCALGKVLVASTGRGLCAILLGDTAQPLRADLARRFPKATLRQAPAGFATQLREVIRHIEQPQRPLALPLDIRGTAFQQRVWKALREIPVGGTASYTDVGRRIRAPRAARAVAQACGANPLAVAIPCHRVLRSDGSLSGYRWGLERKRELLRREAKK
jgi:AraC family transcriptional regulator of adaptative response/methylated-DNA-[protein]-cysteine methyltransferase